MTSLRKLKFIWPLATNGASVVDVVGPLTDTFTRHLAQKYRGSIDAFRAFLAETAVACST
jgi:hypothetical protein